MKRLVFLLLILITHHGIHGQKINGLWLSHVNSLEKEYPSIDGNEGKIIVDFDQNTIGYLNTDKKSKISSNKKQTKLKIKGVKGKLRIQKQSKDKIVLKDSKNISYIFERLDLSHKLQINAKEIRDFVLTQQCDLVDGIKGKFTKEQFFIDKKAKKPHTRYQFINFSQRDNGYWYVKTIKKNTFFILNTAQNETENIFQVTAIKVNGITLRPLLATNSRKDFTWFKACL